MRGATFYVLPLVGHNLSFNPRAPCGARLYLCIEADTRLVVSIHTPHAGRDLMAQGERLSAVVSIHAPHAGRDQGALTERLAVVVSIHAPHAGRDRAVRVRISRSRGFQSTRPMRGATLRRKERGRRKTVSIHAPHAGRDKIRRSFAAARHVSIHAPHAGRDMRSFIGTTQRPCFNPRAPCGARLEFREVGIQFEVFQSTRPVWGATRRDLTIYLVQ